MTNRVQLTGKAKKQEGGGATCSAQEQRGVC